MSIELRSLKMSDCDIMKKAMDKCVENPLEFDKYEKRC